MNQLTTAERAKVVSVLVEGNSLRATSRITGVARMTVEKLLRDLGAACTSYHNTHVIALKSQRIQCDEIWSFIGAKAKNVSPERKLQGWGDVWTWTAIDADSKLMVSWLVGERNQGTANAFMQDVAARLSNRVQLTTDGFVTYLTAVDNAFGVDVDFGVIQKTYAAPGGTGRYSPPKMMSAKRAVVTGDPRSRHISTSYVERQNLTMRMHMRRFTRLTNGFSKKIEMHEHSVALHFTYYNFCKIHQTLRVTPAMEAGLSDHVWSLDELVGLMNPFVSASALSA
jgi:IS1 family transposase